MCIAIGVPGGLVLTKFMPIPHAEKLIERAQKGERLNSNERRHCLAFLMATSQMESSEELATLFQVSGRLIRADKKYIREEKAKTIKDDDIALVIADIAMTLERQMRDLERSKYRCTPGTVAYLRHCTAIHEVQLKTVSALQDLGYYPKNLGLMTVEKWNYKATVSRDGSVLTRPIDMEIGDGGQPILDADYEEVGEQRALPPPEENEQDLQGNLFSPPSPMA